MGSLDVMQDLPAVSIIETYPQLVGFNPEIYTYFRDQCVFLPRRRNFSISFCTFRAKYCGYNVTLTYPQRGRIPLPNTFRLASPSIINRISNVEEMDAQRSFLRSTISYLSGIDEQTQRKMKRDSHIFMGRSLENRANDSADPWYGCFHLTML
jgi:carboxypeptidase D